MCSMTCNYDKRTCHFLAIEQEKDGIRVRGVDAKRQSELLKKELSQLFVLRNIKLFTLLFLSNFLIVYCS